jgi:predicted alpha/beta-hydrolase family hydrolase
MAKAEAPRTRTAEQSLAFLFAPGAGAPSSSDWMQAFAQRFEKLGRVACFDYRYQVEGRRSPDRLERLIEAHQQAFETLRAEHSGPIVFVGKSMGSRIGCHLANQMDDDNPLALVCLGYPLVGQKGAVRDEVLIALRRPILFIQGTRDALCPLERLNAVRKRMSVHNELHVVQGGDHSLRVSARAQSEQGRTQPEVDAEIVQTVSHFLESLSE